MRKELIASTISQILILSFNFLSYKLILVFFGKNAFLDYSILKRFLTFLYPLSTLGMGVTIPKFVSFYKRDIKKISLIILSALIIIVVFNIIIILILFLSSKYISKEILKNPHFTDYLFLIFLMIIWYSVFMIQVSLFRGLYKVIYANIIQIISLVIVPLAFLFISNNFKTYLLLTYFSLTLISIIGLSILYKKYFLYDKFKTQFSELSIFFKRIFIYGLQRVPADIGLSLIFLLPVIFYSHQYGYEKGGYLAFSISLFSLLGTVFAPFNFVILPKIGILLAEKKFDSIKIFFYRAVFFSLMYSIVVIILFFSLGSLLLSLYIGKMYIEVFNLLKYLIWGVLGYSIFVALRGFIDAIYEKGINSIIIWISLVFVVIVSLLQLYEYIFIGFIIMGILALTFLFVRFTKNV